MSRTLPSLGGWWRWLAHRTQCTAVTTSAQLAGFGPPVIPCVATPPTGNSGGWVGCAASTESVNDEEEDGGCVRESRAGLGMHHTSGRRDRGASESLSAV